MKEITLQDAVVKLCTELINDKNLYSMWQSNIAMAFFDQVNGKEEEWLSHIPNLGNASNVAAHSFLN